jgi:hypothetical protein
VESFFRHGGIGLHALHGRFDFASTLSCEFFTSAAKFVGRFAPSF